MVGMALDYWYKPEAITAIGRCYWEVTLAKAAAFLSDVPAASNAEDDAQRQALARMPVVQIRINDDWGAAAEPQPRFAAFVSWDDHVRRE